MRSLFIILLSIFLTSFTYNSKENSVHPKTTTVTKTQNSVIICTGKYSKRYHNHICKGLKACKAAIVKISIEDARKKRLTPCGYCY